MRLTSPDKRVSDSVVLTLRRSASYSAVSTSETVTRAGRACRGNGDRPGEEGTGDCHEAQQWVGYGLREDVGKSCLPSTCDKGMVQRKVEGDGGVQAGDGIDENGRHGGLTHDILGTPRSEGEVWAVGCRMMIGRVKSKLVTDR